MISIERAIDPQTEERFCCVFDTETCLPIEKDRYGRTVAEVYVQDRKDSAINLNVQMVRDGYAWHYEKYSGKCPIRHEFAVAQELAQKEGLGIWNGNPQPPWEFRRKANK